MFPSRKCQYALDAILYIGCHSAAQPVSSKEIAQHIGFPVRYLEQIMQKLVHKGILRGVRGPRGGYVLARDKRTLSMAEVCTVLESIEETPQATVSAVGKAVLEPIWNHMRDVMHNELANITLDTLCQRARETSLNSRQTKQNSDFTI